MTANTREGQTMKLWRVTLQAYGSRTERLIEATTAAEARRRGEGQSSIARVVRVERIERQEG